VKGRCQTATVEFGRVHRRGAIQLISDFHPPSREFI
jgi:hypothetical protein